MTVPNAVAAILWVGVTAYALFGGAFGAGFWDLVAGGAHQGRQQRALIEHSIGAVWEANDVWLIFVLVVKWTAFPGLFGAVSSTLWASPTARCRSSSSRQPQGSSRSECCTCGSS